MRLIPAALSTLLAVLVVPAFAGDCKSEFSAVVTAMRSGGPMRRADVVTKNGILIEEMVLELSPPDQLKIVTTSVPKNVSQMFVSGKKAWTVSKGAGKPEEPPKAIEGAGAAESILRARHGAMAGSW